MPLVVADVNAKVTARQNDMARQKFFQSKTFENCLLRTRTFAEVHCSAPGLIQGQRDA